MGCTDAVDVPLDGVPMLVRVCSHNRGHFATKECHDDFIQRVGVNSLVIHRLVTAAPSGDMPTTLWGESRGPCWSHESTMQCIAHVDECVATTIS